MRDLLEKREVSRKAEIVQLIEEQNELIAIEKRRWAYNLNYYLVDSNLLLLLFFTFYHRQEIFARERRKILQQHADDIIGFLPRELIESDM